MTRCDRKQKFAGDCDHRIGTSGPNTLNVSIVCSQSMRNSLLTVTEILQAFNRNDATDEKNIR